MDSVNIWYEFSLIALVFYSLGHLFLRILTDSGDRYIYAKAFVISGAAAGVHSAFMLILGAGFRPVDMIRYLPASVWYIAAAAILIFGQAYVSGSRFKALPRLYPAALVLICVITGMTGSCGRSPVVNTAALALILTATVLYAISKNADAPFEQRRGVKDILIPALLCAALTAGRFFDGRIIVGRGVYGSVISGYLDEGAACVAFGLTFLIAALTVYVYLVFFKKEKILTKQTAPPMIALGVCGALGQFSFLYVVGNEAIRAVPVTACAGILSVILKRIFLKEKAGGVRYAAAALAAGGIALLALSK